MNRLNNRLLKSRERKVDAYTKKTEAFYRNEIDLKEKRKALQSRILKAIATREKRDSFRQKIAKENGVNWKRVHITNWRKLEYIIV